MSELVNSYLSRKKIKPNSRWLNTITTEEFVILNISHPSFTINNERIILNPVFTSDKEYIMVKYYHSPQKYVLTNFDLIMSDIETETIICIHDPTIE